MSTPVLFPDVELWACGYLRAELGQFGQPDVAVSNTYTGTTAKAVWVRRDGGPRLDQARELARLTLNVFAPTEQQATDLARTVAALMCAAADGRPVVRIVQTTGPSPVTDTKPRRLLAFEATVRGTDLT